MMRKAGPEDVEALTAFLADHVETSMFLLSNLERFGTEERDAPHGTTFYLHDSGGAITGVFGATNHGFLLCQHPGLTAPEAQAYARLLEDYRFLCMTGDDSQVSAMLAALSLEAAEWQLNEADPLYRMDLHGITQDATTRAVTAEDVEMLTGWYADNYVETQSAPSGDLAHAARQRAEAAVGAAHVRLLVEAGRPTAMASLNARAGTAVQLGDVFVPKNLRGRGRGGTITRAIVAEAALNGAETAILFARSRAAARVYERIGFRRCGDYRIAMLRAPVTLGVPA